MTVGIYFIEANDLYYIGQSVNIEKRFYEHMRYGRGQSVGGWTMYKDEKENI